MTPATPSQVLDIDARRREGCRHPHAGDFQALEFLACRRCGVTFVDGSIVLETPQPSDPPGEHYLSSYAGDLHREDDP